MDTIFLIFIFCCALVSYLLGSLPFGLWVGLAWRGIDIRTVGSGNIGATNVFRALGPAPAVTVLALDALKGAAGILAAVQVCGVLYDFERELSLPALIVIGLSAVLGHTFSPFLQFKGGKGIASSLGMLLALNWLMGVIGLGVWILAVAITRYVSIASILAACSLPVSALIIYLPGHDLINNRDNMWNPNQLWMTGFTLLLALYVAYKHRANLLRLRAGTEPKFGQRVAADPPAPADTPQEER